MKFHIRNRFSLQVQFTCELDVSFETKTEGEKLGRAVRIANLGYADLRGANLGGADLSDTDLRGANLGYADLRGANLGYANLGGADLSGADLSDAYLIGTNLIGTNLNGTNLNGVNLSSANLSGIKEDFFKKLSLAKMEAVGLYDAIMRGKINGSVYEGECACFVGTIAKITNENYQSLSCGLRPDSNSPIEKWFSSIGTGNIPQNNQVSEITAEWLREFMDNEKIKYPRYEIVAIEEVTQIKG